MLRNKYNNHFKTRKYLCVDSLPRSVYLLCMCSSYVMLKCPLKRLSESDLESISSLNVYSIYKVGMTTELY